MKRLARLRDCLLDRSPQRALFCTYEFHPEFFEGEVLPAVFPDLALDPKSGSRGAYFAQADLQLPGREVVVCCDHSSGGKDLPYQQVTTTGITFHPKLLLVDYGDRLRAVVTSANLSRPGWTSQLEVFALDDLVPGQGHGWARPLEQFLAGVQEILMAEEAALIDTFVRRLQSVGPGASEMRVLSTFEGPLLDRILPDAGRVERIDVVSPFFEGEEGPGVFDELLKSYPKARGRLFVRAYTAEGGGLNIEAPRQKIETLVREHGWTLHQVSPTWEGDIDDAPPRQLHGKLLMLVGKRETTVLLGSANFTRAALLSGAPPGNAELCVLFRTSNASLRALLPEYLDLELDRVTFVERESEAETAEGAEQWVRSAFYRADTKMLELSLTEGAPPIDVMYEGRTLATGVSTSHWSSKLQLGERLEVEVVAGGEPASIAFVIRELSSWEPRGTASDLTFDEFLDVLAGARDIADAGDTLEISVPDGERATDDTLGTGGAIAWRKLLRALEGIEQDLVDESPFPVGVRRLMDSPYGIRGLLDRLASLTKGGMMLPADHAFAVHELGQALRRARGKISADLQDSHHLLDARIQKIEREYGHHLGGARGELRKQLVALSRERV